MTHNHIIQRLLSFIYIIAYFLIIVCICNRIYIYTHIYLVSWVQILYPDHSLFPIIHNFTKIWGFWVLSPSQLVFCSTHSTSFSTLLFTSKLNFEILISFCWRNQSSLSYRTFFHLIFFITPTIMRYIRYFIYFLTRLPPSPHYSYAWYLILVILQSSSQLIS